MRPAHARIPFILPVLDGSNAPCNHRSRHSSIHTKGLPQCRCSTWPLTNSLATPQKHCERARVTQRPENECKGTYKCIGPAERLVRLRQYWQLDHTAYGNTRLIMASVFPAFKTHVARNVEGISTDLIRGKCTQLKAGGTQYTHRWQRMPWHCSHILGFRQQRACHCYAQEAAKSTMCSYS